jgi:hypothetical protein
MYLDWVNNFITLKRFAEYYDISAAKADRIIKIGRAIHNNQFKPQP